MECRTCSESLTALMDGELNPTEGHAIEAHLGECPNCREEYESLAYSSRLIGATPEIGLNPELWRRIESKIGPARVFFDFRQFLGPPWTAALAAGVVVSVLSMGLYWSLPSENPRMEGMLNQYVRERDQVELIHRGIIEAEPVGWIPYNPFTVSLDSTGKNPFSTE